MLQLGYQTAITIGILLCCFTGPTIAIFFLLRRKRRARSQRRSPLISALLRGPGHSLLDRLSEAQDEVTWDGVQLMLFPLLLVSTGLAQIVIGGVSRVTIGMNRTGNLGGSLV